MNKHIFEIAVPDGMDRENAVKLIEQAFEYYADDCKEMVKYAPTVAEAKDFQEKLERAEALGLTQIDYDVAQDVAKAIDPDKHCKWWSTEDVVWRAKDIGLIIDNDQGREILKKVIARHDASVGINWDVIDYWIYEETEVPDAQA